MENLFFTDSMSPSPFLRPDINSLSLIDRPTTKYLPLLVKEYKRWRQYRGRAIKGRKENFREPWVNRGSILQTIILVTKTVTQNMFA